ncbi:MAG: PH domain-containing protein [Treponema sp.]|nr:PH domain-containing protein [Treponema sp.]
MLVIIIPLVILTFGIISSIKNTTLTLTEKELIIKSALYGRKIPLENIMVDGIKGISLDENTDYNLSIRTNGTALPQFKSGWFRLKNREKALVFVTDKNNVVLIPTKDYLLLFSMNNIDEFINKIKALKK